MRAAVGTLTLLISSKHADGDVVGLGRVELPTSPLSVVKEHHTTSDDMWRDAAIHAGTGALGRL